MFKRFPMFDGDIKDHKRSRSIQCYYFNNLDDTCVPNATYQLSRPSAEKKSLKGFTVSGHGDHLLTDLTQFMFIPVLT